MGKYKRSEISFLRLCEINERKRRKIEIDTRFSNLIRHPILLLPREIWIVIMNLLEEWDLNQLFLTSKLFRSFLHENPLPIWRKLKITERIYPENTRRIVFLPRFKFIEHLHLCDAVYDHEFVADLLRKKKHLKTVSGGYEVIHGWRSLNIETNERDYFIISENTCMDTE